MDVLSLLAHHPEITALLARNDYEAVLIWQALAPAGWRVPQDVSLVGFDDASQIPDASGADTLTTVHSPLREIGMEGARLLLRQLLAGESMPHCTVLPTHLVVRRTTGPPRRE